MKIFFQNITYNHLNLTTKISNPSDTLLIQYDALGNKIRQIAGNDTLYFVGGAVYLCNAQSAMCKVKYLALPEGYLSYDSINIAHSTLHFAQYHAVIKDYLGSVRMVINADSNKIEEVNHYDPFGVEYGLSQTPFGVQLYKHQGMERLNVSGFSLHYHFARNADNLYGRWLTRDKLEEDDYWNGAYVYCRNNPKYIDPDGKWRIKFGVSFTMNTGIVGFDVKLAGFALGVTASPVGGAKQEISVSLMYDSEKKTAGVGASYKQTDIENSYSVSVWTYHASESSEKSDEKSANTIDGNTSKKDTRYEKNSSGGVGLLESTESADGSTTTEISVSAGVNLFLLGIGAKIGVTIEPTSNNNKEKKNN